MLTYDEFKQAIDDRYITGHTVAIVRKNGQIFDYVLSNEKIRDWEVVT
ncbi:Paratox, partial [Streptococcus dysgalactiae subsp. equisimilis]